MEAARKECLAQHRPDPNYPACAAALAWRQKRVAAEEAASRARLIDILENGRREEEAQRIREAPYQSNVTLLNAGRECYSRCGVSGPCEFCGDLSCCKAGHTADHATCGGKGGKSRHECTPGTPAVPLPRSGSTDEAEGHGDIRTAVGSDAQTRDEGLWGVFDGSQAAQWRVARARASKGKVKKRCNEYSAVTGSGGQM